MELSRRQQLSIIDHNCLRTPGTSTGQLRARGIPSHIESVFNDVVPDHGHVTFCRVPGQNRAVEDEGLVLERRQRWFVGQETYPNTLADFADMLLGNLPLVSS